MTAILVSLEGARAGGSSLFSGKAGALSSAGGDIRGSCGREKNK